MIINKCVKHSFETSEEAFEELERIITTQRKPWLKKDKKPCRIYQCPKCNCYHLTSQPSITTYYK